MPQQLRNRVPLRRLNIPLFVIFPREAREPAQTKRYDFAKKKKKKLDANGLGERLQREVEENR
jgi:hypothetical protein